MSGQDTLQTIKTRLNMIPIYGNYKSDINKERFCQREDDVTEHLITCTEWGMSNFKPDDLSNDDNAELWRQINEMIQYNMDCRTNKN